MAGGKLGKKNMKAQNTYPSSNSGKGGALKALLIGLALVVCGSLWYSMREEEQIEDFLETDGETTVALSDLLAIGLGLTAQAATAIRAVKQEHSEHSKVKGLTKEGVEEPVTDADNRSNKVFVNGYRNHFPGIHILSEETDPELDVTVRSEETQLNPQLASGVDKLLTLKDLLIIFDPLDATKEFTEDLLEYVTTMVCIVYKGEPIAGIINQVFEETPAVIGIVGTETGKGTVLGRDGRQRATGEALNKVAISRSHTGAGADVVSTHLPDKVSLQAGGAGYKSLLVLDGTADAYVHVTKIKSWDVCAPDAVLRASGGSFGDIDGKTLKYGTEDPVFTRGILATQVASERAWYVEHLDGKLE